jgi:hypothetical protein
MKTRLLLTISLLMLAANFECGKASAAPIVYDLPPETAAFAPDPNLQTVIENCTGCHSAVHLHAAPRTEIQAGFLEGRSQQDGKGLWSANPGN